VRSAKFGLVDGGNGECRILNFEVDSCLRRNDKRGGWETSKKLKGKKENGFLLAQE
jgi:hypothetical protein